MNRLCYDCDAPLPTREAARAHVCVPLAAPAPGTSYVLETYTADRVGLNGSYAVDIVKDGKTVVGIMSSRGQCEKLLRIRGFHGPYAWPSVAESKAQRLARRARPMPCPSCGNPTVWSSSTNLCGACLLSNRGYTERPSP